MTSLARQGGDLQKQYILYTVITHDEPSADAATTELIALADAQDRLLAQV